MKKTQAAPTQESDTDFLVLLYYCFTPIENHEQFREQHHIWCLEHNLKGRIIVAPEGLNGTVSGLRANCEAYMQYVKADARFANIDFKAETTKGHTFEKLHVRAKEEIVHSGLTTLKPWEKTGVHIEPAEFKNMKDQDDVVLVDFRSTYEHSIGHFKGAVTLDIDNFRDFPQQMEELSKLKDKKIITYCTGGIKCEKASAFLLEQGFENVYQLHGGIIKYGIEEGGEDFEGKCYVFDNRLAVDVNRVNPKVISKCFVCGTASERMINCANALCNNHVAMCEKCGWDMEGACSALCQAHPNKRIYDGTGYYQKTPNGYNPYIGLKRSKKEL
ncbi:MAG: rhodanese-related sulfurtransferase [Cytophagales bacterium]